MAKRHKLQTSKSSEVKKKNRKIVLQKKENEVLESYYLSQFCLTDNYNFALFNMDDEGFIFDKSIKEIIKSAKEWEFKESDLQMIIDRNVFLTPEITNDKVIFDDIGSVDKTFFDLIVSNRECIFQPVIEWSAKESNRLVAIFLEKMGKPIGILKTVKAV